MLRRIALSLALLLVASLAALARPDLPAAELEARYGQPPSQFMEIDGVRLHFRDEGSGPPLVLIHGTFSSLHTWQGWVEALQADYRLLRLDLPGHGLTGPRPDGDYSRRADVELVASWLDELGLERVSLAGNSLGGAIAWRFALAYPERVDKLILIDSAGLSSGEHGESPLVFQLLGIPVLRQAGVMFTPRFLFERSLREVYAQGDQITDELIDRYYLLLRRQGNRAAMLDRLSTSQNPPEGDLNAIQAPTLILWGEQDRWIPLEVAYQFQQELPNAELVIIPQAGHVPMEERPQETAQLVASFLARW